jgi:hypothetical protein
MPRRRASVVKEKAEVAEAKLQISPRSEVASSSTSPTTDVQTVKFTNTQCDFPLEDSTSDDSAQVALPSQNKKSRRELKRQRKRNLQESARLMVSNDDSLDDSDEMDYFEEDMELARTLEECPWILSTFDATTETVDEFRKKRGNSRSVFADYDGFVRSMDESMESPLVQIALPKEEQDAEENWFLKLIASHSNSIL